VLAERYFNAGETDENKIVPAKLFLPEAYSMLGSEI
jgi:hypothetical protein